MTNSTHLPASALDAIAEMLVIVAEQERDDAEQDMEAEASA